MGDSEQVARHDTVLIIGAGSTGLALAQGLGKAGVKCVVFEKHEAQDARDRDWNLGLHWGAPVLESLIPPSSWEQIQSVQVDPNTPTKPEDTLQFFNAKTGELMGGATMAMFYRLRRSKLRALLAKDVDVRYSKKLSKIEYADDGSSVTAEFEDGTSETGRIVVGADGAKSQVRNLLFGERAAPERIPFSATFVQAKFSREQALHLRRQHKLYLAGIHPAGLFAFFGMQDAPDPDRPENWTFFFYISWPSSIQEQDETADWTNEQRMKQVKEKSRDFADPWKSAFEWIPDNHPCWYHDMSDWDPARAISDEYPADKHGGKATIAGDAAHTMTYQRGQGLNHSLTDAKKLTDAIASFMRGDDYEVQKTAIAEYEKEMVARGGDEVRLSTKNTKMLHDWGMVMQSPVMTNGMKKS
ncbi:FAD/NAD(P)-binding domain-containing protein [Aulographum hederae CBS 113979]|uniref:FAD/NAD(P)-binding domain-containing protein n=1 Tax=Aulographum hederae CBS 113979 TaxID=1176131 RepID=A0A6G1GZH7_9PEZI|nr:FAD/NAD(P)-binding domain-containing protein [Aulographum hederae CBS 113979]